MSKPWIFVSPSSRGIGHALTAHLLRSTTLPILATARSDPNGVKESILTAAAVASNRGTRTQRDSEDAASRLHMTYADVTDESSIKAASEKAATLFSPASYHLHMAFTLPGILHPEKHPRQIDYDAALETFKVNVLGPLLLMKWFGEFLPKKGTDLSLMREQGHEQAMRAETRIDTNHNLNASENENEKEAENAEKETPESHTHIPPHATYLTASARLGSTTDNTRLGGWYSYRASKAGVHSIARTFDLHLRARSAGNAIAFAYHPGTVKTGLSEGFWDGLVFVGAGAGEGIGVVDGEEGGEKGEKKKGLLFSPDFAVRKMLEVVGSRTVADRGKCWDWKGEEVLP